MAARQRSVRAICAAPARFCVNREHRRVPGGQQRQAFLVTFGANAKSDWPRAAMERAGGKRTRPAKNNLGRYQFEVR